jgi:hypothetical protein
MPAYSSQAQPTGLAGYAAAAQDFFLGTFAPFLRASDKPIAIACLRLFTVPPLPDFSVPDFLRRMALLTLLAAASPYLRPLDFSVAIAHSCCSWKRARRPLHQRTRVTVLDVFCGNNVRLLANSGTYAVTRGIHKSSFQRASQSRCPGFQDYPLANMCTDQLARLIHSCPLVAPRA